MAVEADADGDGKTGRVLATSNHPFFTASGWRDAGQLSRDDRLATTGWNTYPVSRVIARAPRQATVHNLTVANSHTYLVFLDGVPTLVHNCGYNPNQRAMISLAKRYRRGVSKADARTLDGWRREYGVPGHGPMRHPNRGGRYGNVTHIKIHNVHIRVL